MQAVVKTMVTKKTFKEFQDYYKSKPEEIPNLLKIPIPKDEWRTYCHEVVLNRG